MNEAQIREEIYNLHELLRHVHARLRALEKKEQPGDDYSVFDRLVNFGFTPSEHFRDGSDDITWVGWASYTGFVNPSLQNYAVASLLHVSNTTAARWFKYRAASTGALITFRARVCATFQASAGLMVDDGVDAGDGLGANNFYRVFLNAPAGTPGNWFLRTEYRTGGGSVTTTDFMNVSPGKFYGLMLLAGTGTRWTSWGAGAYLRGESAYDTLLQYLGGVGWSWTPTRVGLYGAQMATNEDKRSIFDLYDD